jgi:hypothetical protein
MPCDVFGFTTYVLYTAIVFYSYRVTTAPFARFSFITCDVFCTTFYVHRTVFYSYRVTTVPPVFS